MDQLICHTDINQRTRKIIHFIQKEQHIKNDVIQQQIHEELFDLRFIKEGMSAERNEFVEQITPLLSYDFHKAGRIISGPDYCQDCAVIILHGKAIVYARKNQQELEQEKYWMNQVAKHSQDGDLKKLQQIQDVLNYYVKNSDVDLLKKFYKYQKEYFQQSSGICLYKKVCHLDDQEESTSKIGSISNPIALNQFVPLIVAEVDTHALYVKRSTLIDIKDNLVQKQKRIDEIVQSFSGILFSQREKLNYNCFIHRQQLVKSTILFIDAEKTDQFIYLINEGSIDIFSGQYKLETLKRNDFFGYEYLAGEIKEEKMKEGRKRKYTAIVSSDQTSLYCIQLELLIKYFPNLYSYLLKQADTLVLKYAKEKVAQKNLQERDFKRHQIQQQLQFGMNQENKANQETINSNNLNEVYMIQSEVDNQKPFLQYLKLNTLQDSQEQQQDKQDHKTNENDDHCIKNKKLAYHFQITSKKINNSGSLSPVKKANISSRMDIFQIRKPADLTKIKSQASTNITNEVTTTLANINEIQNESHIMRGKKYSATNLVKSNVVVVRDSMQRQKLVTSHVGIGDVNESIIINSGENNQIQSAFQRVEDFQKKQFKDCMTTSQKFMRQKRNNNKDEYSPTLLTLQIVKDSADNHKLNQSQNASQDSRINQQINSSNDLRENIKQNHYTTLNDYRDHTKINQSPNCSPKTKILRKNSQYSSQNKLLAQDERTDLTCNNQKRLNKIFSEGNSPILKSQGTLETFSSHFEKQQQHQQQKQSGMKYSSLIQFNDNSIDDITTEKQNKNTCSQINKPTYFVHKRVKSSQQLFQENSDIFNIQKTTVTSSSPSRRIKIRPKTKEVTNNSQSIEESYQYTTNQQKLNFPISKKETISSILSNAKRNDPFFFNSQTNNYYSHNNLSHNNNVRSIIEEGSFSEKPIQLRQKEYLNRVNINYKDNKLEQAMNSAMTDDRERRIQAKTKQAGEKDILRVCKANKQSLSRKNSLLDQIHKQEQQSIQQQISILTKQINFINI